MIVGIGINAVRPAESFPEELRQIAGAVFERAEIPELRARLAAGVLDRLMDYAAAPNSEHCFEAYRSRSLVLGKPVKLLIPGREPECAEALALNRDYSLQVRLPDGSERAVSSGEVSVRVRPDGCL